MPGFKDFLPQLPWEGPPVPQFFRKASYGEIQQVFPQLEEIKVILKEIEHKYVIKLDNPMPAKGLIGGIGDTLDDLEEILKEG